MMDSRRRAALGLAVLLASGAAVGNPATPEETPVLFVLDASGSMWGRIDSTEKITVARATLIQLIDELADDQSIGLIAYGHRREGDCDDIELLVPIAPGRGGVLVEHVQRLNPKGKTPISRALRLAAAEAEKTTLDTAVVLLSDGIENCDPEPCGRVASLIESGARMRLFVVGFDVDDDEAAELECLARAGRGAYFGADSAANLLEALISVAEAIEQPEVGQTGTLIVTASGHSQVTVFDRKGDTRIESARTNTAVELGAGFYRVELGRSSRIVQVRTGQETRLGAGSVVVTGLGEGLYGVYDVTGEHKIDFTRTNTPIDVLEGSYLVELEGTRRVAVVEAGETTTIAAASVMVTGDSGRLYAVYDPTGTTKYEFTRVGRPIEVLPGFYSVKIGDDWHREIELNDGDHVEIAE